MSQCVISDARCIGKKFSVMVDGEEVSRAYLYVCWDDEHQKPFGFLSGVSTDGAFERRGFGTQIVKQIIQSAKEAGCYKLIDTSRKERTSVHEWYTRLGFTEWGKEFRMDFKDA